MADHTFGISFQDSEINEDWLPSFLNFKVDSTDCDLFSLVVVGEKKGAEVAGEYVTAFDVEGMKFSVFHLPKGGYRFEIHNPANEEVRCILTANADFSKGECTLCGSRMLRSFSLGNFLMMMFGFASAFKNTLLFHSSVIEKDGKGFLFLGRSGTGKSTHSRLWMEHIEGGRFSTTTTPWCA